MALARTQTRADDRERSSPDRRTRTNTSRSGDRRGGVADIQRRQGNQAVQALVEHAAIQPNLRVSSPKDPAEREAERVAERIFGMTDERTETEPDNPGVPPSGRGPPSSRAGRYSSLTPPLDTAVEDRPPRIAHSSRSDGSRSSRSAGKSVERGLKSTSWGRPLPPAVRSFFEPRFDRNFGDVRIHTDGVAADLNRALGARAFTHGSDVYFGAGQFQPEAPGGRKLLAHELTHVVQQTERAAAPGAPVVLQRLGDTSQVPGGLSCPVARDSPRGIDMIFQFQIESSALHPDDVLAIENLVDNWHAAGANEHIRLDGYASSDGPDPLNWRLSCARASAVKNALTQPTSNNPGIPASYIEVFAHGETDQFSSSNPPNRRVTLQLEGGPSAPTPQPTPTRVVPCRKTPMNIFTGDSCGADDDFQYNDNPSLSGVSRTGRMLVWQADNLSTDFRLRNDMRAELGTLAGSEGLRMVNHFASGSGTKLTHDNTSTLGRDAVSSGTFSRLHGSVVQDVERQLSSMDTSGVIDCNNISLSSGGVPAVSFGFSDSSALKGIIGGTQGLRIRITHFSVTPGSRRYDVGLQYLICDDFGVDTDDLYSPGLAAFWVLQHRRSGYRPFINELDLSMTATGTY